MFLKDSKLLINDVQNVSSDEALLGASCYFGPCVVLLQLRLSGL